MFRNGALEIIRGPVTSCEAHSSAIELRVDRPTLAKRRWRATAADGAEFGFDLREPLSDGSVFFHNGIHTYVVRQLPESLLCVRLTSPEQAALVAWQIGNLHFSIMVREAELLVEDDPAIRQMFQREEIIFGSTEAVFRPLGGGGHHHF